MAKGGAGVYSQYYSRFFIVRKTFRWRESGGAFLGFSILNLFQNPDAIDHNIKTVQTTNVKDQTGWDRLKSMFQEDGYGNFSPELSMVMNAAMMGGFTGTIIGGTLFSKSSFLKFMQENQGTAFENSFDAKKQLQTKVTLGFGRGAWIWGWRLSLFCGSFMLCTTSISVYRGKSSIWEYIIAGGTTGALFKFKQGPRAIVAGGILGGALGSVAGCLNLGIMYITGTSMEDLRYWQHQWRDEHQAKRLEKLRKARTDDLDILSRVHEEKMDSNTDMFGATNDITETKK